MEQGWDVWERRGQEAKIVPHKLQSRCVWKVLICNTVLKTTALRVCLNAEE